MDGVKGPVPNLPAPNHAPVDGIPADTTAALQPGPAQPGDGALQGRTVAVGNGENNRAAHAACAAIKSLIGGLSNALLAVVLSPVALLKGIHAYVIKPCMEEFSSMWDDANSAGTPRPVYRPPAQLSALDRTSQSFNDWINQKLG